MPSFLARGRSERNCASDELMSDTLGIDLGTSSIKVGRFDRTGRYVASAVRAYHDTVQHMVPYDRIWQAICDATRELIAAPSDRPPIIAVGVASQSNSFAVVNDHGRPIARESLFLREKVKQREERPSSFISVVVYRLTDPLG